MLPDASYHFSMTSHSGVNCSDGELLGFNVKLAPTGAGILADAQDGSIRLRRCEPATVFTDEFDFQTACEDFLRLCRVVHDWMADEPDVLRSEIADEELAYAIRV